MGNDVCLVPLSVGIEPDGVTQIWEPCGRPLFRDTGKCLEHAARSGCREAMKCGECGAPVAVVYAERCRRCWDRGRRRSGGAARKERKPTSAKSVERTAARKAWLAQFFKAGAK